LFCTPRGSELLRPIAVAWPPYSRPSPKSCEPRTLAKGCLAIRAVQTTVRNLIGFVVVVVSAHAIPVTTQELFRVGAVSTPDGRPLARASVTIQCGSKTTQRLTDESGQFIFEVAGSANCYLTVITPWLATFVRSIAVDGLPNSPLRITVSRDP